MTQAEPLWTAVAPLADLPEEGARPYTVEGKHLVVGRDGNGAVFALDNRCPHEGYPLAQGLVKGCILTCAWHNWKFDVTDGSCVLGGEPVRHWPSRVVGGMTEVDLREPDRTVEIPRLEKSLREALGDRDVARGLRDGARLLRAGRSGAELLSGLALYDALHAEYGTTHVLPLAADCAAIAARFEGGDQLRAVAPVLDLCAFTNQRLPARPRSEPTGRGGRADLIRIVEDEHVELAEAVVRGWLQDGVPVPEVEATLYALLSRHFTDFGHQLIYLVKAQELLGRTEGAHRGDLYGALVAGAVWSTREDTLPYMRGYFRRLEAVEARLAELWETASGDGDGDGDGDRGGDGDGDRADLDTLRAAFLDASVPDACAALLAALESGLSARTLADVLVDAAAERVLRFDVAIDANPDVAEAWLWATHRYTFACAVRVAVERFPEPDCLRYLFQALAFVHSGRKMDGDEALPAPSTAPDRLDLPALRQAIERRDRVEALARLGAWLEADRVEHPFEELASLLEDLVLQDRYVLPIFTAHAVKTTMAALEVWRRRGGAHRAERGILAAARFLASPLMERRLQQQVRGARRWVEDGVGPKKLTQ